MGMHKRGTADRAEWRPLKAHARAFARPPWRSSLLPLPWLVTGLSGLPFNGNGAVACWHAARTHHAELNPHPPHPHPPHPHGARILLTHLCNAHAL